MISAASIKHSGKKIKVSELFAATMVSIKHILNAN
jgi:hypothetical protein